jgi:hypothetical protein
MNSRPSPALAAFFAAALLALGFAVGYGFHTAQSTSSDSKASNGTQGNQTSTRSSRKAAPVPPVVKGLHISPDGTRVAFTAVYKGGLESSRFVLNLKNGQFEARQAPRGWQDFVVQWGNDGRRILLDRERIPRSVADTQAGLHEENLDEKSEPRPLTPSPTLPSGEKSVSGLWTSSGDLVVKTRREPKTLFVIRNGRAQLADRAAVTYYQNRVVRENGRDVLYVVRDVPGRPKQNALFRVENGRARQISSVLGKIEWAYVAENARWLIVCRTQPDSSDWQWTLYRVSPQACTLSSTRSVPSDVISVFWSPNFKSILGTSGNALWAVDIPSLQSRQIGKQKGWNADDAGWLPHENAVLVAARGTLWKVDVTSGAARAVWKFPTSYWD